MKDDKVIPLVSIIVPVYKVKVEYLIKCIDSLRKQTLKNIEIIIVDDGSKDESSIICDEMAKLDSRIKVIHQENQGVSVARNNGMLAVSSKYVAFVDSDDWISENMCEDAYDIATKNKADIVFFPNYKEFINKSIPVDIYKTNSILEYKNKEKFDFNPYNMKLLGSVWGKLYSYELIKDLMFDDTLSHGEEVEFNFRAFSKLNIGIYVNNHHYHYRYIETSVVRTFRNEMIEVYNNTLIKIEKVLKDTGNQLEDIPYKAFYTFVGIIYIVICSNYIFSSDNKETLNKKMKLLKDITYSPVFKERLKRIDLKSLPLTRRMPIIFAKLNMFYGVYFIIKVRQVQCKLYNYKGKKV